MNQSLKICLWALLALSCSLIGCKDDEDGPKDTDALQLISAQLGSTTLSDNSQPTGVALSLPVTLRFDNQVDRPSAESAITMLAGESPVAVALDFLNNNRTITVRPEGGFLEGQRYQLLVNDLLVSEGGLRFKGAEFSFVTGFLPLQLEDATVNNQNLLLETRIENLPPKALSITLKFSSAVSIEALAEQLRLNDSRNNITISITADDNTNQVFTITPDTPLQSLGRYLLSISASLTGINSSTFEGFSKAFYTALDPEPVMPVISDEELLTLIQTQTFKYFWDFAHPASGMARERNTSGDLVTLGGSGFGAMAILVGIQRGFITRAEGVARLEKIVGFLKTADRFHGVWPHWLDGNTGKTIPFSADDDGGDLVETALMIQGLLTVRQFLNDSDSQEAQLITDITTLWEAVEWDWHTQGGQNVLYWHWSPNVGWKINLQISGWNESLIVYTLAAASPTHAISPDVYQMGWARNGNMTNGKTFFDTALPLGPDLGGPLFYAHYSFLGMDPRNLKDQYADYWVQNTAHTTINQAYCEDNPNAYIGYSAQCWGITASDNNNGYSAHAPDNDLGVITPTAALSSIPYAPSLAMDALKFFYYSLGDRLWGPYGFYDAFNLTEGWVANSYLAIDQGPIIIMIENYRSQLLWDLFMQDPEVRNGLGQLGFTYE